MALKTIQEVPGIVNTISGTGGGGITISEDAMMIPKSSVQIKDGKTYLIAGKVTPDVEGLDTSVVREGVYFETLEGILPTRLPTTHSFCVSDNGVMMYTTHSGNAVQISRDGGKTWISKTVTAAGYRPETIATNHKGVWILLANRNNIGSRTYISFDDGETWQVWDSAFEDLSGGLINGNDHLMESMHYHRDLEDPSANRWICVYAGESGVNNGGVYVSDGDTHTSFKRTQLSGIGIQGAFILPPVGVSRQWVIASSTYNGSSQSIGGKVWASGDGGETWRTIGIDDTNWEDNKGVEGLFYAGEEYFLVTTGSSTSVAVITCFHPDAADTSDFFKYVYTIDQDPGETYWRSPRTFNGTDKVFKGYKDGVTYFGDGYASLDGKAFIRLRETGRQDSHGRYPPFESGGQLWDLWTDSSVNFRVPWGKSIPVAGSAVPYNEGGLAQYIRIK